jgi:ribose-phosphate pyrophosphokinase
VGNEKTISVVGNLKENAVIFDDMIDTGERIRLAAPALKAHGAKQVYACATHAVLSGCGSCILVTESYDLLIHKSSDVKKLQDSEVDLFICTNTIPVPAEKSFPKLKVLQISNLLAEAIRRLHNEESMSDMF